MWCELAGLRIWYDIRGEGTPIVFLHGWTMDHRDEALEYEPIFAMRRGWQRIYFDLPGMGQSPSSNSVGDQDGYLDAVLRFLDAVIGDHRFVLAGTSAGAYLARGVVHRRAACIDGLALKVPLVVPADAKRTLPLFRPLLVDPKAMESLSPAGSEELREALLQHPAYLDALRQKYESRLKPAQLLADHSRLEAIRNDPRRYGFSFDVDRPTAPFEAPTLIVCGRQDIAVGYRDAWTVIEQYPRATFAVLDRADHGLPVDRVGLFRALVSDWLDRIEEWSAFRLDRA